MYAASRSRFVQACQQMARQLKLPGCHDPKIDAVELIAGWLAEDENGPWLLIVDNADDANLLLGGMPSGESDFDENALMKPLMDYLPRTLDLSRRLLITTRTKDVADSLGQSSSPISVGPFSLPEARLLLRRKVTQEVAWPPDNVVDELLTSFACIPLAITQAAAFINRNVMTIADYLRVFQTSKSERMRQLSIELQDSRRERGFPNSVFRTWRLSFDQMRQRDAAAAALLSFLAFMDRQSIPLTLVRRTQAAEADWRQALGTVVGYSLVVTAADETISIHPLVQESVRYWLEQQEEKESSVEQAVSVLAASFPSGEYDNWGVCQTLLPHAQAVLRHQGKGVLGSESRGHLQYHVSWFLQRFGRFEAAIEYISESYNIFVALLGDEAKAVLRSLMLMAVVLQYRGKYEEAEAMNRRALAGWEKELGVDHPNTWASVSNLASALVIRGKYVEAEEMTRRALAVREKELGWDHLETFMSIGNLALVLHSRGKDEEAEIMNRRALAGYEKELGGNHPYTLTSVNNLAVVLRCRGKYDEAEIMSRRALAGREKKLGMDHSDTLQSVHNLAYLLDVRQDFQQAADLYQRAVTGSERVLGPDHPETAWYREHLSSLLERMKSLPLTSTSSVLIRGWDGATIYRGTEEA